MVEPTRDRQLEAAILRGVSDRAGARRNVILRLLSDPRLGVRALRSILGQATPMQTEDRRVLEQIIFGHYARRADIGSILFVGCQWYTAHYQRQFFPDRDYWTIDPDPKARRYGGRRHRVIPLERLNECFPESRFDLIICNGVYGFGLDDRDQCERAFARAYSALRKDGQMVLGWTNVPARTPVILDGIESLARFNRFVFPELGTWRYVTDTPYAHTYDFYLK
jgi:hypothetical protein